MSKGSFDDTFFLYIHIHSITPRTACRKPFQKIPDIFQIKCKNVQNNSFDDFLYKLAVLTTVYIKCII